MSYPDIFNPEMMYFEVRGPGFALFKSTRTCTFESSLADVNVAI
jgi:hypothetical protein